MPSWRPSSGRMMEPEEGRGYGMPSERFAKDLAAEIPDVDAYFGSHHLAQVVRELGVDYREELLGERQLTIRPTLRI